MAERGVARPSLARQPLARAALIRYRMTPWWLRVAVIWVVARAISTAILLWFASQQGANAWTGPRPDYLAFAQLWDSTWFHIVAVSGYPTELPLNADGQVQQNAWAFLPAYPFLVRGLMAVTGLPWAPLSVFVSVAFSLAGTLMVYRVMRLVLPQNTALFAVVVFSVAPLSPILQVSYAESLSLFLLATTLYLLMTRRYLVMAPVVAVLALTRPGALALALALAGYAAYRYAVRAREPFELRERILVSGVTVFTAMMGFAWPAIAWLVTGSVTAYTDTELAWRASYVGYGELIPFTPWFQGAAFWMPGPVGIIVLVVVIVGFFSALFLPSVRRLGPALRLWLASYALYLLAVFFPQSSTFRLLIPLFPLAGAIAQPRSRVYRVLVVLLSILGQAVWVYCCWWVDGRDWTPP